MDPATTTGAAPREKSIWPMFAGAMLLFVLFGAVVLWMLGTADREAISEEAQRAKQRQEILAQVQQENKDLLSGYGWVDRELGIVRIPLDEAMALAVTRLQGEPRPAYPIDPTIPLGAAFRPGGYAAPPPTPPPFAAPPAPEPEADTPAETGEPEGEASSTEEEEA